MNSLIAQSGLKMSPTSGSGMKASGGFDRSHKAGLSEAADLLMMAI